MARKSENEKLDMARRNENEKLANNAFFQEMANHKEEWPFNHGESTVFWLWRNTLYEGGSELTIYDGSVICDSEMDIIADTFKKAGIESFVYASSDTGLIRFAHAFDAKGYKLDGICMVKQYSRWSKTYHDVQGIRFKIVDTI